MIILLALTEKQVVMAQTLNANPISGRQSIFARVNAETELKQVVEIVGIYSTLERAGVARTNHALDHPNARYLQKVATLDDDNLYEQLPAKCIRCQTVIGSGSYCPIHQQEYYEECRRADALGGKGDDVPLVHTDVGQGPQHLVLAPQS